MRCFADELGVFCDVCASASVGPRWWHRLRLRHKYGFGFAINTASASQRYRLRHITKSCTTLPGGLTGPPTRGRSRAYLFQGARKVGPPIPPPLPPLFCASASVCGCPLSPVRQYMLVSPGSPFPFLPPFPPPDDGFMFGPPVASASVCGCPLSPERQYMLVSPGSPFPFYS